MPKKQYYTIYMIQSIQIILYMVYFKIGVEDRIVKVKLFYNFSNDFDCFLLEKWVLNGYFISLNKFLCLNLCLKI